MFRKIQWVIFLIMWGVLVTLPQQHPAIAQNMTTVPQAAFKAIGRGVVNVEGGIIKLSSQKDGIIKDVLVEEGDRVKKGQVLAIQDDSVAVRSLEISKAEVKLQTAQLQAQKAQLKTLNNQAKRLKPLIDIDAEPRNNYEELMDRINELNKQIKATEISVSISRKRVNTSQSDLDQYKIVAPLDGVIIKRIARPGVGASTLNVSTLFWLVPDVPLQVVLVMESQYFHTVKEGDPVVIHDAQKESVQTTGRVARVGRVLAPKSADLSQINEPYEDKYFECLISLDNAQGFIIGQNVIVKFKDG